MTEDKKEPETPEEGEDKKKKKRNAGSAVTGSAVHEYWATPDY